MQMAAQVHADELTGTPNWVAVLGPVPRASSALLTLGASPGGTGLLVAAAAGSGASIASEPSCGVIFDGVLYNREEIAPALGINAAGLSDARLLLAAYERWGAELTRHIKGVFALVIWDGMQRRLLAIRDPLGAFPLFYATGRRGTLLVSTSLDALVTHPAVDPSLNRAALTDHLLHRWPYPDETFYQSVRRVPGGCRLISKDGHTRVVRYWDPAPEGEPVSWVTAADLEGFPDLLNSAVERAVAGGRAGIFLSGGLDSISVATAATDVARRLGHPEPVALSLGFPHPDCDEEIVQRGVANTLAIEHEFVPFFDAVPSRRLLAPGVELARTSPAPLINTWSSAYLGLARRGRRRGVDVILTGSGGDEWLTVTPYLCADLLRSRDFTGFARLMRMWQRSYRLSNWQLLKGTAFTFGIRPLAGMALNRIASGAWRSNRIARLRKAARRQWLSDDPSVRADLDRRTEDLLTPAAPSHGFYFQEVRGSLDHPLVSMEMEEAFEIGRRIGVRFQHPYWDAEVVELLYRTPPELLVRDGRAKGLVRETVAKRFASLGLERQKKVAATSFYQALIRDEVPQLWKDSGGIRALAGLGIVDAAKADAITAHAISRGDVSGLTQAWDLVKLEAWVRPRLAGYAD
jgi:asparagine synthase (glutamine-hydrolysing)